MQVYRKLAMSAIERYNRISDKIKEAALACGRSPDEIRIIAVSKTFPSADIQAAIDSGIKIFGESRIQEAAPKISMLKGDFTFHFIGHLQSNKSKEAVRLFDLIHSIDKAETAAKVSSEAEKAGKIQKILIQVNSSSEDTKSGCTPESLPGLFEKISALKNIEILGLMTIGPLTGDDKLISKSFAETKKLLEEINSMFSIKLKELSMGMSSDYLSAVREGATMVRIGSAIFGERDYN